MGRYQFAGLSARNATRLVFLGESAGSIEQGQSVAGHDFDAGDRIGVRNANQDITAGGREVFVPHLKIVRFLGVGIEHLTDEARLRFLEGRLAPDSRERGTRFL